MSAVAVVLTDRQAEALRFLCECIAEGSTPGRGWDREAFCQAYDALERGIKRVQPLQVTG